MSDERKKTFVFGMNNNTCACFEIASSLVRLSLTEEYIPLLRTRDTEDERSDADMSYSFNLLRKWKWNVLKKHLCEFRQPFITIFYLNVNFI
jgi:hypothetical protein